MFAAFNTLEHRQKNSYAMHAIKLLLTYYLNISVQAANLSDCRIESNRIEKIDSVARIESNRNFFARIGMLCGGSLPPECLRGTKTQHRGGQNGLAATTFALLLMRYAKQLFAIYVVFHLINFSILLLAT